VLVASYTGAAALCAQLLRMQYLAHSHLRETEMQALTDHLTGLPNLRALEKDLRAAPEGCLLLIDIDHFKWVNDNCGHPTGDLLLQHVAATIQRSVRAEDLVSRHGGEEFAVLLRPCRPEEAGVIAERVRANVAGEVLTLPNGETLRVTISGGLCPVVPGPLNEQIARADKLLYRAKAAGRNRICRSGGQSLSSTGTSSKEPTTSTSTAPTTAATPSQIQ
jgi:diguanylate cyclase (GGDEF)-like protein